MARKHTALTGTRLRVQRAVSSTGARHTELPRPTIHPCVVRNSGLMDQLDSLRLFIAVAEARSFAAAARAHSMSPARVTRGIAALERRLGVQLLNRTTRQTDLTEPGARFLADCKRILAELQSAEETVRSARREPQGLLTVTAPVMFGRMHIAPLLHDFLEQHPKVNVRGMFVDRIVNLIEERIDVALRIDRLADSSLTAVKLGCVRRVVV